MRFTRCALTPETVQDIRAADVEPPGNVPRITLRVTVMRGASPRNLPPTTLCTILVETPRGVRMLGADRAGELSPTPAQCLRAIAAALELE